MPTRTTARRTARTSSTHPTARFKRPGARPHGKTGLAGLAQHLPLGGRPQPSPAGRRSRGMAALAGIGAVTAIVARRKRAHREGDQIPRP